MKKHSLNVMLIKQPKRVLSQAHTLFNKLSGQIKALKSEYQAKSCKLDEAMQFYFSRILPQESALLGVLVERIQVSYKIYKKSNAFSKSDIKKLKQLILGDIYMIGEMSEGQAVTVEIRTIWSELSGIAWTIPLSNCSAVKEKISIEGIAKQFKILFGINIDPTDIDMSKSPEEIVKQFLDTQLDQEQSDQADQSDQSCQEPEEPVRKTKKQQEQERKQKAFEVICAASVGSIYKQLVKSMHPDLEQDNARKIIKEEFIKRLISAYKENDLYALLHIKMEWANHSASAGGQVLVQEEELIQDYIEDYIVVLKEQVKVLKADTDRLVLSPRYAPIAHFFVNHDDKGLYYLKVEYNSLKKEIGKFKQMVARLRTPQAYAMIKSAIKEMYKMSK
ncbi:MAG: hypothetical protein NT124_00800 [Candidatus Dependentiae bacterium]|nr:hypothetical protein [Candidatus Dependentiae bacterium]